MQQVNNLHELQHALVNHRNTELAKAATFEIGASDLSSDDLADLEQERDQLNEEHGYHVYHVELKTASATLIKHRVDTAAGVKQWAEGQPASVVHHVQWIRIDGQGGGEATPRVGHRRQKEVRRVVL